MERYNQLKKRVTACEAELTVHERIVKGHSTLLPMLRDVLSELRRAGLMDTVNQTNHEALVDTVLELADTTTLANLLYVAGVAKGSIRSDSTSNLGKAFELSAGRNMDDLELDNPGWTYMVESLEKGSWNDFLEFVKGPD